MVPAAYGPRIFSWRGIDQMANVIRVLREKISTRQAVIQIFDGADLASGRKDVPCTCTLHFLHRDDRLHLITTMRSNDAVKGLPHDVFAFTMFQELVARSIGAEVGKYTHCVDSFHIYEEDWERAKKLLGEGWQQTIGSEMAAMPDGDPWPTVKKLLVAEREYRTDRHPNVWPSTGEAYQMGNLGTSTPKRIAEK